MRKFVRAMKLALLSLIALLLVAMGAILGYRAYLQHLNARALAIDTPNGIDEAMYVKAGGIDQWIQIRGRDRGNPVLLCVHGGPGATWTPLTALFVSWEKDFTVVQWDQRGAGRTLEATGASVAGTMSIDRMTQDGIEVAEFVRSHLHKDRIFLLGHSWGSILGVRMAKLRPDLFYAYVGTGQVSDMQASQRMAYDHVLDKARAANDRSAIVALEKIGRPPYDSLDRIGVLFRWIGAYSAQADRQAQSTLVGRLVFTAPNFSLWDIYNRGRGFAQVPTLRLYQDMLSTDLSKLGPDFAIPVFFFEGMEDEVTPAALARAYFDAISAPRKEFVPFEGAGHFAAWTQPDKMLRELVARVRPLAPPSASVVPR